MEKQGWVCFPGPVGDTLSEEGGREEVLGKEGRRARLGSDCAVYIIKSYTNEGSKDFTHILLKKGELLNLHSCSTHPLVHLA